MVSFEADSDFYVFGGNLTPQMLAALMTGTIFQSRPFEQRRAPPASVAQVAECLARDRQAACVLPVRTAPLADQAGDGKPTQKTPARVEPLSGRLGGDPASPLSRQSFIASIRLLRCRYLLSAYQNSTESGAKDENRPKGPAFRVRHRISNARVSALQP
jgi:hypothetical protein